jgi:ABC-type nickel/cobalt efflux system permease component RcnA
LKKEAMPSRIPAYLLAFPILAVIIVLFALSAAGLVSQGFSNVIIAYLGLILGALMVAILVRSSRTTASRLNKSQYRLSQSYDHIP